MVDQVFKHKRGVVNAAMYCHSGYCQPKRLIGELNSEGKLNCQNSHFLFQLLKHNKKPRHKSGVYICWLLLQANYNLYFELHKESIENIQLLDRKDILNEDFFLLKFVYSFQIIYQCSVLCSINQHHTSEFQI